MIADSPRTEMSVAELCSGNWPTFSRFFCPVGLGYVICDTERKQEVVVYLYNTTGMHRAVETLRCFSFSFSLFAFLLIIASSTGYSDQLLRYPCRHPSLTAWTICYHGIHEDATSPRIFHDRLH